MDHIVPSCGPIFPWINMIFISTTIVEAFFLQNLTYNWQKCQTRNSLQNIIKKFLSRFKGLKHSCTGKGSWQTKGALYQLGFITHDLDAWVSQPTVFSFSC